MATLTLTKLQRDNLRGYVSTRAKSIARGAFPEYDDVPEDRDAVMAAMERTRAYLGLLDRIGWELETADDEQCVVDLDDDEAALLLTLKDEIRKTFEYDHRDDDGAALAAVFLLEAEAVA